MWTQRYFQFTGIFSPQNHQLLRCSIFQSCTISLRSASTLPILYFSGVLKLYNKQTYRKIILLPRPEDKKIETFTYIAEMTSEVMLWEIMNWGGHGSTVGLNDIETVGQKWSVFQQFEPGSVRQSELLLPASWFLPTQQFKSMQYWEQIMGTILVGKT